MVAKRITELRKDCKQKSIAEKLLERFSEVKKNDDENFKIQSLGEEYTDSIFSPVSAIMLTMAEVYGTFNLPVTCIDTDISIIDLENGSFPVDIRIMTTQPGLMDGENHKYYNALLKRLSEVFHIAEEKLMIRFVTAQDIHVIDF